MTISSTAKMFCQHIEEKYKGRVHSIERRYRPDWVGIEVHVSFRIPEGDADELEVFRRINKVIHVIAEGDDDT